ncbi:hypothetical protein JTE90_029244 [Oedothorax gibbosus]|uniref:Uncharacterized protein n=1 Tax=Oedothorax gibbosus TaxID=931172 RepID=A0AAV6TVJ4_9ARAC|nr:hypothetical protein JTE90_029244 [Oedothorax gibbosus]
MPGHGYYSKLLKFIADHFQIGELFLEFLRFHCQDSTCDFCSLGWSGPTCTAIKRPYLDYSRAGFHYLNISETPLLKKGTNVAREVDDFQPRAQLKKLFSAKLIASDAVEEIENFSKTFIVPKPLVLEYIRHLEFLKMKKSKKMKVNISPPSSCQEGENSDSGDIQGETIISADEYSKNSDLDDVMLDIGTSESETECDSSSDSDVASIFTRTRSGRIASTWKSKKYM